MNPWSLRFSLGGALLGCALLAWNASHRPHLALDELRPAGRYWEDLALSGSRYLQRHASRPGPVIVNGTAEAEDLKHGFRRNLVKGADELGIRPWQFWRTVPLRPFLNRAQVQQRPYEDAGRPLLMSWGYVLLGGVAPYLGLWLALLASLPFVLWTAWELARGGRPLAGAVFALALGASCFVADVLTMAYSAAGFHVAGLLLLTALACHAFLAPAGGRAGLLVRCGAAGLALLVFCLCRTSTLALLPPLLAAALVAGWRTGGGRAQATRAARWALLGAALVAGPYAALRAVVTPTAHDTWATLWEGLGDFDRSKGFVWSDPELRRYLRGKGLDIGESDGIEFQSPLTEDLTRQAVLQAIRADPGWYAGILVRRVAATLTLWKLRPWGPLDGRSMAPAEHPNEGNIDVYWSMTSTADFFGLGPWRGELGLSLILAPLVLLPACWLRRRTAARARAEGAALCCLAAGALALPVAVSVASSFEPQAFVLVPLLALALLLEGQRPTRPSSP